MGQFQNSVVKHFWSFLHYLDQTKMFRTWIFTRYLHILRVKMKNNSVSETSSSHFAQLAHFLEPHFFFEKPSKINVKVIDIVWTQLSKSLSDFHKTPKDVSWNWRSKVIWVLKVSKSRKEIMEYGEKPKFPFEIYWPFVTIFFEPMKWQGIRQGIII